MQNPMHKIDPRVDGLYRLVKGRVDWENLIPTCIEVAREIEQMKDLSGSQKLALLQDTLKHGVIESESGKKDVLLSAIDTVIPIAIQAAVLASKLPIQKIQASCFCWKK